MIFIPTAAGAQGQQRSPGTGNIRVWVMIKTLLSHPLQQQHLVALLSCHRDENGRLGETRFNGVRIRKPNRLRAKHVPSAARGQEGTERDWWDTFPAKLFSLTSSRLQQQEPGSVDPCELLMVFKAALKGNIQY